MHWKTSISTIKDGEEIIRGYRLKELIEKKSFAEVIFLLLRGKLPTAGETVMMNALLVACIDHGVGAPSATVARTVVSAGNSFHTAVAAGVQTLGELHGGAIEGAAKFFQEHADEKDTAGLVARLKEQKIRIPGFGHKVLARDVRSDALLAAAKKNNLFGKHSAFAERVETELNKISSKPLPLNIDGAMGAIISDLGFDWRLAKAFFIIGRAPGLAAHVYEELTSGEGLRRISEDDIDYTGDAPKSLN